LPAEEVRARVAEALALVCLAGVESRAPHHMSGGEERKAALAAALAMRPELLLLDEPTSDLDSRSRRELLDVVRHLPGGKVIASHDFEFLHELCDRVAVLSDGRIRGEGTPAAVFGDEDLLARCGLELSRGMRALLGLGRA
jgi:cobalt/nickel transport system ATP-binding protein